MERKIKERRRKGNYSVRQIQMDDRAIKWEIEICKILKRSKHPEKALLTDIPEEYRWNMCHYY